MSAVPIAKKQTKTKPAKVDSSKIVTFLPGPVYDLVQFAFFPLNYMIGWLCHLQPGESVWNDGANKTAEFKGSGKELQQIAGEIIEQVDIAHNEEDLVRLYDSLPDVDAEQDLIGRTWQGRILRTNRSVLDLAEWLIIRPLKMVGVNWGKRYRDQYKGDPLLFRFIDRFYVPVAIWGNVGMTNIQWRESSTATMNYDYQPWKDYFKLLSNEDGKTILLGVWTHKDIAGGWFTLTLDEGVKI